MTYAIPMSTRMKRPREEYEGDVDGAQQEQKKARTLAPLPFRASPTKRHSFSYNRSPRPLSMPPTLTPDESSDDDEASPYGSRTPHMNPSSQMSPSTSFYLDADEDFEMSESNPLSPIRWENSTQRQPETTPIILPPCSQKRKSINGTRIPTPIYGHFNTMDISSSSSAMDTDQPATAPATTTTLPPISETQQVQHDLFLRRRRLPSPINENEDPSVVGTTVGFFDKSHVDSIDATGETAAKTDLDLSDAPPAVEKPFKDPFESVASETLDARKTRNSNRFTWPGTRGRGMGYQGTEFIS